MSCITQWMQIHVHPTWKIKGEGAFFENQVVRGRSLHTTRSIARTFLGVVLIASSHLYDVLRGSDCM